jgi:uncharacterized protein YkwD
MRNLTFASIIYLITFCSKSNSSFAQIYTAHNWNQLIELSKKDTIAKIERMAALEFHRMLNQYRKENKLDTVVWNETLWLACRNHCIWMEHSEKLSHSQKTATAHFTGESPGQRYNYAAGGYSGYGWSGENALYNYSGNQGKIMKEKAVHIAAYSFKQWKNSPGHNANMLNSKHGMHGVAFIQSKSGNRVWGTSLFATCSECPPYGAPIPSKPLLADKSNPTPIAKSLKSATNTTKPEKKVRLNTQQVQQSLTEKLYAEQNTTTKTKISKKSSFEKIAVQKAKQMIGSKDLKNKTQYIYYSTHFKTNKIKSFALLKNEKVNYEETTLILEKPLAEFDAELLASEIISLMSEKHKVEKSKKIGFGVVVRKVRNVLRIAVVRIWK